LPIQPLQLPGPLVVPTLDWRPLDRIGDAITERQQRQAEAEAFGGLVESIPTRGEPTRPTPSGPPGGQLPRGLRNNNPLNIEDGQLAKSLPGYKGNDGRFAIFDTPDSGLNAADALLTSYGRRGLKTVGEVIGRWAPKNDGNNVDAYSRFVSSAGDPNETIDLSDPAQRKRLIGKMAIFENGMHAGAPREGVSAPVAPPSAADVAAAQRGMPADMKKRVQALFAVGTPAATQVALGLVSKFIGKQEPIKLGEGDVLIDPDTGKVVGRAPGKSQSVRAGGAIVQDGKVVYESPGDKKLQEVELSDGTKMPVVFDPGSGKIRPATSEEVGAARQNGDLPPEVSSKVVKNERSQALVKNEEAAVSGAQSAGNLLPVIDAAIESYERAAKLGGVGPNVASPPSRFVAARFSTEAEVARQDYERALAAIQANRTAIQNKGLGAASDFERKLYAAQYPSLDAASSKNQVEILKQLKADAEEAVAEGKKLMLGKQPGVRMDRPPVRGGADQVPQTPGPTLPRFGTPEFDALPPGAPYIAPDGSVRAKRAQ
jgi:hypothetical protein